MTDMKKHPPYLQKKHFGAIRTSPSHISFRIWAPKCTSLFLSIMNRKESPLRIPMIDAGEGVFELNFKSEKKDIDYFYEPQEGVLRPDPHSRWQPFGVHGPSRVHDTQAFEWSDAGWKGIPLAEYIIYELHIGTFTAEGTFEGAIQKLEYLCALGVTAIELMPIIEFPGNRNWGYDGVYPYAPHHAYGGPQGLKAFVNACHKLKLAVILDVVYNHLGPEGNYSELYGHYFTDKYQTPWGRAVNFDGPYCDYVRHYFIDNALYWLEKYHIDALRLDATHAIYDFSPTHILDEMQEAFRLKAKLLGREAFLFIESDLNDRRFLSPRERGGYSIDAQWNDDFHHSIHAFLTKSTWSYLQDFGALSQIAKSIKEGFVYDGEWSSYRKKRFGSSSADIAGEHFVVCIQNHDQVGNAGKGQRLGSMIDEEKFRFASALLFCAPNIPLIFMGQEWNALTEFFYFTSFEDIELGTRVSEGYKKEFNLKDEEIFSPQDLSRFEKSKIQWSDIEITDHRSMLDFYKMLIRLRSELPFLRSLCKDLCQVCANEQEKWMAILRSSPCGSWGLIAANFSDADQRIPFDALPGTWELILSTAEPSQIDLEIGSHKDEKLVLRINESNEKPVFIDVPAWTVVIYQKI